MRSLFGKRSNRKNSRENSIKISGPIGEVEHRIHIDHGGKAHDKGYESKFYRRHLDPQISNRLMSIKIPAVSDDFVSEMTVELSRLTKTQSMDALDNYELVENEKKISVCSPTRSQSQGLKRNVSKSWHDNLDAIIPRSKSTDADLDTLSVSSRELTMETTTSSELPPAFTPPNISISSSGSESRERPFPKARSIENLADVRSFSESEERERKLAKLLQKFGPNCFGPNFDSSLHPMQVPIPPERKSVVSSGDERVPEKPSREPLKKYSPQNEQNLPKSQPVPKPRGRKVNNEEIIDHAVYL